MFESVIGLNPFFIIWGISFAVYFELYGGHSSISYAFLEIVYLLTSSFLSIFLLGNFFGIEVFEYSIWKNYL